MLESSNDAPIGCVEGEGFVSVGQYSGGNGGSSVGIGVGGKRCQLCYFVVLGPKS